MNHELTDRTAETAARLLGVVRDMADELHPGFTPAAPVSLDSKLDRDLAFDSLGRVELLARVEQTFDVSLSESVFTDAETPRDLLRAVMGAGARVAELAARIEAVVPAVAEAAPASAATLIDALDWHAERHPDRPHIHLYNDTSAGPGDEEAITYAALRRGAREIAAGLQHLGVEPGEPVAIMLATGPDYFHAFFGILMAGAVAVPLYPPARMTQIEDHLNRHLAILENCRAGIMITTAETEPVARLLQTRLERLRAVITPDALRRGAESFLPPAVAGADVAFLQYTSGSTGDPKGVILTHANLLANIRAMGEALEATSEDVFVSWLPLYHDMGLIGAWLGSLYFAAPLVIMSPLQFLARPQRWLWAIHRYRATLSAAPNFAFELCLRRIRDEDLAGLDLSSWRGACNGAEAVSAETLHRFADRFGAAGLDPRALMPVYGLAENSVGVAFPPVGRGPVIDRIRRAEFMSKGQALPAEAGDAGALVFVGCGFPLPRHEVRIVDTGGRELPDRQEGRLQFRGPSATSGYFRAPDKTGDLFDGDWLDSGDKAYVVDGEIFVTGRTKDIIIRAGRNIYPAEIEEAVGELEGIQNGNVAVFGSLDSDTGTERLVILAESRARGDAARASLSATVSALVADLVGEPPDDVVLAPPRTVPKTSSGKIRRDASRRIYEDGRIGAPARPLWVQVARIVLGGAGGWLRRLRRVLGTMAFAAYAWILFALAAPLLWLAVLALPRPAWRRGVVRGGLRLLARLAGTPLTLRGTDNLPPADRASVLVANHASYLDGFVLTALLPRDLGFIAKGELRDSWATRLPLARMGTVFVERFDRKEGARDADRAVTAVRKGQDLLYFPEGTISRMTGLLPFHMGAFLAAAQADAPVVPIAIRGTRGILRDGTWFPRRGAITVEIGEAIDPADLRAQPESDPWEVALGLRDRAREQILRHCGEPDLKRERSPLAGKEKPEAEKPGAEKPGAEKPGTG